VLSAVACRSRFPAQLPFLLLPAAIREENVITAASRGADAQRRLRLNGLENDQRAAVPSV
jgi:hypothetical protein